MVDNLRSDGSSALTNVGGRPGSVSVAQAGEQAQQRAAAGGDSGRFNANELLRILIKWKWLLLGTTMAFLLLAVLITLAMTPIYMASATLEITSQSTDVTGQNGDVTAPARDDNQFLNTQFGLLRTRALAVRVADSLNLAGDDSFGSGDTRSQREASAINRLQGNFVAQPEPASNLIRLTYTDPNAQRAANIVNAFGTEFIASNIEQRYDATAYARQFLQSRLAGVRERLEQSERQLVAYAQQQGILDLSAGDANGGAGSNGSDSLSAQSLVALNQALSQATTERITAEQTYRGALANKATMQVMDNPTVQQLRGQRATLQAQYDQKLATFKPDLPEMKALHQQIASIDADIVHESTDVASALKSAYLESKAREDQISAKANSLRQNVLSLRDRGIQYNILRRDVDTNTALYNALLQRYKEIGVAGGVGENQAALVDPSTRPGSPYMPRPILNALAGLIGGLVLGFAVAFAIEFMDDTIKSPDDVIGKLKVPLLGLVPKLDKNQNVHEEMADPRSELSESYFSIMTALKFSTARGMPRTVLVSSSRQSEGKTSTSFALAQNAARVGASVLLIDADLRKPSFRADAPEGSGLSTLLTTEASIADHVFPTYIENLSLMPGGGIPPNPAELLATGRIAAILEEAKSIFDIVIVDAPPVLGLADAPILASVCEATVMIVESGVPRRSVLNSLRRLEEGRAAIAGVVLTKFNPKTSEYGYGYGYAYGYGQRYGEGEEASRPLIDMAH